MAGSDHIPAPDPNNEANSRSGADIFLKADRADDECLGADMAFARVLSGVGFDGR